MGYNSRIGTLRDGEKLRYAKEAALAVVRQLRDEDLVGVIAFDSQPHEIAPLGPLRDNRETLLRPHAAPGGERRHGLLTNRSVPPASSSPPRASTGATSSC